MKRIAHEHSHSQGHSALKNMHSLLRQEEEECDFFKFCTTKAFMKLETGQVCNARVESTPDPRVNAGILAQFS